MLGREAYEPLQLPFAQRFVAPVRTILTAYGRFYLPANEDLKLLVAFQTTVFVNGHKGNYNNWKVRPYPRPRITRRTARLL